jgi:hypothetical protein
MGYMALRGIPPNSSEIRRFGKTPSARCPIYVEELAALQSCPILSMIGVEGFAARTEAPGYR